MDYHQITVHLIGNATHDGEVKEAKTSDNRYGDFRVAVRDRNDESRYYPVRCFGKLAASVANIKKGARLFIVGQLETASYTDGEGMQRVTSRIIADTYRILANGRSTEVEEAPEDA